MLAEKHVPGTEFGELQREIWRREFEGLRDGDRFFYLNDPALPQIRWGSESTIAALGRRSSVTTRTPR